MNKKHYLMVAGGFTILLLVGMAVYAMNRPDNSVVSSPPVTSKSPSTSATPTGEAVTLQGTMACLVPKDTSSPQTMSCAIGLKTDDGKYYALKSSDPATVGSIPTGQKVNVRGVLSKQASSYDIVGVVEVESIE